MLSCFDLKVLNQKLCFQVGAESKIKYLVLQVHYINIEDIDIEGDSSGIYVYYTKEKVGKSQKVFSTSSHLQ